MEKQRNGRNIIIATLCVAVIVMAVGYAALTQNLYINGTAEVTGASWDVHFTNLVEPSGANLVGTAENVSAEINTDTTVMTFSTKLIKPGDKAIYTVDVVNNGNLKAEVTDITNTTDIGTNPVTYTVSGLSENDVMAPGATQTLTVAVEYNDVASDKLIAADTTFNLSTVISFAQTDKAATIN